MGTILTYQYRYRNLFISLISLIMIYPFMQDMDDLRIFFNFFVSWLLFTSAGAIIQDRKQFRMVMLLGVPTFILLDQPYLCGFSEFVFRSDNMEHSGERHR